MIEPNRSAAGAGRDELPARLRTCIACRQGVGTRSRLIRLSTSTGHVRCSPPPMLAAHRRVRGRRPGNASVDVLRRTRRNAYTIRDAAPDLSHRTSCRGSRGNASLPSHRHRPIKSLDPGASSPRRLLLRPRNSSNPKSTLCD
jgi:hypothetical protein